jgi:hypothetical protein
VLLLAKSGLLFAAFIKFTTSILLFYINIFFIKTVQTLQGINRLTTGFLLFWVNPSKEPLFILLNIKAPAMKGIYTNLSLVLCMVLVCSTAMAQQGWPKTITTTNGDKIKVYQPQPESYSNNILKSKSAVSVITGDKTEPVFGVLWSVAETTSDGKTVHVQSIQVTDVKFPADIDDDKAGELKSALQTELGRMSIDLQKQELDNALNMNQQETKLASTLSNTPPKVIYSSKPSMLVLIDGAPKWQMNNDWGVEVVLNTPFTIVKNQDGKFYLYGGKKWFTASSVTGPYHYTTSIPSNLNKVETAVNTAAQNNSTAANSDNNNTIPDNVIPEIIVSTEPAELIQSNGEADFSPVEGTNLLYVKNSSNDIFMDVNSQQYYVLLSGRWYKSSSLNSKWEYIASNKLPADFAKITEGSPKDNVLASVAGTEAAEEAVMNAQVPQTAKVDRSTATASITYDGDPEFARIDGTRLQYAVNASGTVLRYNSRYYAVDNGVWFESGRATGPWVVSTARPDEVELIPPSYPVYNVKYVYVYDVTPEYVYMGYTPGYLNTFVYGPTIVYGTGYYYRPWYRNYYYPRPYTWGFGVSYTPWYGWGIGFNFSYGWFNCGFGRPSWSYWSGGWWGGPAVYRPAFCGVPYRTYGYYGPRSYGYYGYGGRNNINININYTNNIYRYRRDVVTHDNRVWNGGRRNNGYANNGRNFQGNRGNNWDNNRNNNGRISGRDNNNTNNDRNRVTDRFNRNGQDNNNNGRLIDRYNRNNNDRNSGNAGNNDRNRFNNGTIRSNPNANGDGGGRLIDRYNRNNNDADNNRIRNNDRSNNNNNPGVDRNRFNNRQNNDNNNNFSRPNRPQSNGSVITPNPNANGGQFQRRSQPGMSSDRPSSQPRDGGGFQRPQMRERSSAPSSQPQFGGERRSERRSDGGGVQQGGRGGNDRGSSNGGGNGNGGGRGRRG